MLCKGFTAAMNPLSHPTLGTSSAVEATGSLASSSSRFNTGSDSPHCTPGHVGEEAAAPSWSSTVYSSGRICCGVGARLCGLRGRMLVGSLSALVTALARQV